MNNLNTQQKISPIIGEWRCILNKVSKNEYGVYTFHGYQDSRKIDLPTTSDIDKVREVLASLGYTISDEEHDKIIDAISKL